MEKRSRVQRYATLRDTMLQTNIDHDDVLAVTKEDLEYDDEKASYQPTREKTQVTPTFKIDQFHNEYLDEFIKEVKEYNIRKGNAVSEDTQINILQELKNDDVRKPYLEEINEESLEDSTYFNDISQQVAALIEEVNANVDESEEVLSDHTIVEQEVEVIEPIATVDSENAILEETRKMNIKIDAYRDNVESMASNVDKTNRILNTMIAILIIFILMVICLAILYVVSLR